MRQADAPLGGGLAWHLGVEPRRLAAAQRASKWLAEQLLQPRELGSLSRSDLSTHDAHLRSESVRLRPANEHDLFWLTAGK